MDTTPPAALPADGAAVTARSTLDRLLGQGRDLARAAEDAAAARLGTGDDPAARARLRQAGIAGASALGVLLALVGGRRRGRLSRNALVAGGVAALGRVAYEAWSRSGASGGQTALADLGDEDEAERRATTLLHAMVAAAKADGHVDEEEASAIEAEMEDLPDAARRLIRTAMAMDHTPEAIGARVEGGQEAREVYAASALLSGRDHPGEVDHLDRLARALGLDEDEARAIEDSLHAM